MLSFLHKLFGRPYPKVLDKVNLFVNSRITYTLDAEQYKIGDLWVSSPISLKGDCEDYALTKQQELINKGIPSSDLSLQLCKYRNQKGDEQGHAVLVYKDVWVLDNRTDIIWRKEQTIYFDWRKDFPKKAIYNGKP